MFQEDFPPMREHPAISHGLEGQLEPVAEAAQLIDTAMTRHAAQPGDYVFRRFDLREVSIELEKHLLGEILGGGPASQYVEGDAEHHGFISLDERAEGRGVPAAGEIQCWVLLHRRRLSRCCHASTSKYVSRVEPGAAVTAALAPSGRLRPYIRSRPPAGVCMDRPLAAAVCLAVGLLARHSTPSDLDTLMSRVLEHRDENWKKLQQYTLNERQTLRLTALVVYRVYGFEREYLWFPREGFFVRSPVRANGIAISEPQRREAEEQWLHRMKGRGTPAQEGPGAAAKQGLTDRVEDIVNQTFEPEFIQAAYILKFKFDSGQYALVGRERMLNRDVLKVEYYPTLLFGDSRDGKQTGEEGGRGPGTREPDDEVEFDERDFERKMNETSLVTLWIDPGEHQIMRYEFRNVDMDFLPARWLVRVDSTRIIMQMGEPFPQVWLPASIDMRFRMRVASGPLEGRYQIDYTDYRLPEVKGRILR